MGLKVGPYFLAKCKAKSSRTNNKLRVPRHTFLPLWQWYIRLFLYFQIKIIFITNLKHKKLYKSFWFDPKIHHPLFSPRDLPPSFSFVWVEFLLPWVRILDTGDWNPGRLNWWWSSTGSWKGWTLARSLVILLLFLTSDGFVFHYIS